jgi:hypothetical protein
MTNFFTYGKRPATGLPLFLEIWKQGNVREFSNGQGNGKKQGKVRDFFLSGK